MSRHDRVAIVHDYLTQRGGAERVVSALADAYPDAPIHTSFYDSAGTFPDFAHRDVRPLPIDRVAALRRRHRLALPLLAPAFSHLSVDADVVLCSSSGWAHGARTAGRKVVYCHTPARWLYQADRYLRGDTSMLPRLALALAAPPLRRWDRRAASSADRYLVNSTIVRRRVAECYGIEAEVVHPPCTFDPSGETRQVDGIEPGFVLCVSRLLPYKNVDAVVAAFEVLADRRLVVVGTGPLAATLGAAAPANVTFVGEVDDAGLRWLYGNAAGVVAASYEDFGLTPVEAASFGAPCAVLRWGGFLDTTVEGTTGVFFDEPRPDLIARAVQELDRVRWDPEALVAHAATFSTERFVDRIRAIVDAEASTTR